VLCNSASEREVREKTKHDVNILWDIKDYMLLPWKELQGIGIARFSWHCILHGLEESRQQWGGDLKVATSRMAGQSTLTPPSCAHSDEGEMTTPALHVGLEHSQSRSGDGFTFPEEEEESSKDRDI
jgi:hypothetical protein